MSRPARRARAVAQLLGDLVSLGARTGRWWVPVIVVMLGIGAAVAVSAKVVVPAATYVMF
ncbi:MAG TPA: hypothetical protein PKD80_17715 [Microthrixaceae bacterium]|jgi:hypothetical protein|nr:hypothetical protein [Microthrixaceae bacterium]HMT25213.1 hypothetical protein [Microthrixaceae bacterium]